MLRCSNVDSPIACVFLHKVVACDVAAYKIALAILENLNICFDFAREKSGCEVLVRY